MRRRACLATALRGSPSCACAYAHPRLRAPRASAAASPLACPLPSCGALPCRAPQPCARTLSRPSATTSIMGNGREEEDYPGACVFFWRAHGGGGVRQTNRMRPPSPLASLPRTRRPVRSLSSPCRIRWAPEDDASVRAPALLPTRGPAFFCLRIPHHRHPTA